jgi:hypothetical protein
MPAKPSSARAETDLYPTVRDYFAGQGYQVQGEVKGCDVAAVKDDQLVVVEMKLRLNAEVLSQAARRQEIADAVYVAIPRPKSIAAWRKRAKGMRYLVERLELGLLVVAPRARKTAKVSVEHPVRIFDRVKDGGLRAQVMREVRNRDGDFNPGGTAGRRLISASREVAIHIACCLERFGALTVRQLERLGTGPHTFSVLTASDGIEGWFCEVDEGAYGLNAKARRGLDRYPEAARHYRQRLKGVRAPSP